MHSWRDLTIICIWGIKGGLGEVRGVRIGQGSLGEVKGRQGRSEEIRGESIVQGSSEGIIGGRERSRKIKGGQGRSLEFTEVQGRSRVVAGVIRSAGDTRGGQ